MGTPARPQNFFVQSGNAQVFVSADNSAGATSYVIQRSLDNVTFTTVATVSVSQYLDTSVSTGVQYYYQMAAANTDGTSIYTESSGIVPCISGEMSLGELRLRSQQRADRVNSQFVTLSEWNKFINLAYFELYDLLVTAYEDYYVAPFASFVCNGNQFQYPLPDGRTTFLDNNGSSFVAAPFYKLLGVDLALNNANNAYVTINKFNFIDRNRFVYPNTASTIYGVFNLQYRLLGNKIEFIPTPSGQQTIRLAYIPRMVELLQDIDCTTSGISGWTDYVICRAAKYALDKEESDTNALTQEILFLKKRIEDSAINRDAGQPDRVSDTRSGNGGWGGSGPNGSIGGW